MKVIKRDGRLQDFELSKITTAIDNSAKDAGLTLTRSELNLLANDVESILFSLRGNDGLTSFLEISAILRAVLIKFKYDNIAKEFETSNKNQIISYTKIKADYLEKRNINSEKTQLFSKDR